MIIAALLMIGAVVCANRGLTMVRDAKGASWAMLYARGMAGCSLGLTVFAAYAVACSIPSGIGGYVAPRIMRTLAGLNGEHRR